MKRPTSSNPKKTYFFLRSWLTRRGENASEYWIYLWQVARNTTPVVSQMKLNMKLLGNDLWFLATFVNDLDSHFFFGEAWNVHLNLADLFCAVKVHLPHLLSLDSHHHKDHSSIIQQQCKVRSFTVKTQAKQPFYQTLEFITRDIRSDRPVYYLFMCVSTTRKKY